MLKTLIIKRAYSINTSGSVKVYDLIPIENRSDEFGSWKFDPFAGHMKLYVKLKSGNFFPKLWKLDETVNE
jgi:hypothetical protein